MQFTRLRLSGFKSFVDPTELTIARGLTGVVGPNGCGKSNLLEAMRWVMGETSAKSMRGAGMDDVIFAGAASRPARNFAEVTLSIDNSQRPAPPAINDHDALEITRRITRDAGSAYKVAGKDARARDVQTLFADASSGAHSPALVRQGQIGELINAKPKNRRRILEEAAGIAGLYARRHEAELRLRAAEANLERVDDVLGNLDAHLTSLRRQARQARKYREVSAALRTAESLLLHRKWREAREARTEAGAMLIESTAQAARAAQAVAVSATAREAAEEALPPAREESAIAGAVLQRLTVERDSLELRARQANEAIAALEGRIRQGEADLERERTLNGDASEMLARLDAEKEELRADAEAHETALTAAAEVEQGAAEAMRDAETALDRMTGDAARAGAHHASTLRRAEEARGALTRIDAETREAREAIDDLGAQMTAAVGATEKARAALDEARIAAAEAEEAALAAEAARVAAQQVETEARACLSEAESGASALRAESDALERLLAAGAAEAPPLLDKVAAKPGYEASLGAALGDDLKAPEAESGDDWGWAPLPAYPNPSSLPAGAQPLSNFVAAPPALARRLAQTGVTPRNAGQILQSELTPGQRLVSIEGDLWRWDGLRIAAADAPSASALQLQRQNRMGELRTGLLAANAGAAMASDAHARAHERLAAATTAEAASRGARRRADEEAIVAGQRLSRTESDLESRQTRREALAASVARRQDDRELAEKTLREASESLEGADDPEALRAAAAAARETAEAARAAMLAARADRNERRRDAQMRKQRSIEIERGRRDWSSRLSSADGRIATLVERIETAGEARKTALSAPEEIESRQRDLIDAIETAETRRNTAAAALAAAETGLRGANGTARAAEASLADLRESRARLEAKAEAAGERVEDAAAHIREHAECEPAELLERLGANAAAPPSAKALEAESARLRRAREAIGAVNLRAEQEAGEIAEERERLGAERDDLQAAIVKLRTGVAALNREGRERLLAAFEAMARNFTALFKHLFGGGDARLVLVESDDPLEAGLEIMCQPPGKKLSTLSLLSGGEQTLTALSLIFAVFLANPAPICVLDEVDAPLDDANITRFCDLLDEMTRRTRTRFLIITHHATTMSRMDRLFGVTMQEKGVSQLVSVDLDRAARLIDA